MYSNQKDQIALENVYSKLNNPEKNKEQINEGISGIYPEEANSFASMIAHIVIFGLPYVIHKLQTSFSEGQIEQLKNEIVDAVKRNNSNLSLKDKLVRTMNYILQKKSRNPVSIESDLNALIPSDLENKTEQDVSNEMKRKTMGIKNYRGFSRNLR